MKLQIILFILVISCILLQKTGVIEEELFANIFRGFELIFVQDEELLETDMYSGTEDRSQLSTWVKEDVGDKFWFGLGDEAQFARYINQWRTKTSIENTFLSVYFHHGIICLVGFVCLLVGILIYFVFSYKKYNTSSDISRFIFVVLVTYIVYIVAAFTFAIMDEQRIYEILLGVVIAINRNGVMSKYDKNRINGTNV